MSDVDLRSCLPENKLSKLLPALISAKKEITNPKKNTKGHNYKYSDLSEVLGVINKPLLDNDLLVMQKIVTAEKGMGINTILFHSSGEQLENTFYVPDTLKSLNKGNALQEIGSMTTYLKRYALITLFCLGTDDDDGASYNARKMRQAPVTDHGSNLNTLKKQVVTALEVKKVDVSTVKGRLAKMEVSDLKKVLELCKQDGPAVSEFIAEYGKKP